MRRKPAQQLEPLSMTAKEPSVSATNNSPTTFHSAPWLLGRPSRPVCSLVPGKSIASPETAAKLASSWTRSTQPHHDVAG